MEFDRTQEIVTEISHVLFQELKKSDVSIRLVLQELGWKGDEEVLVDRNGAELRLDVDFDEELLAALRDATAAPDTGAWFRATVVVYPDGRIVTDFDYDSQPDLDPLPILAEDLKAELENWPRTTENIPEWFHAKMVELGVTNPRG